MCYIIKIERRDCEMLKDKILLVSLIRRSFLQKLVPTIDRA